MGLEPLPEGADLDEVLSDSTSRAGDGMETPFEGTRTKQGDGEDASANNADNKA